MSPRILGIDFFSGSISDAVSRGIKGGLLVVPSAPALAEINCNLFYREALLHANLVIPDSGFMVLIWRVLERERIPRISGLAYLRELVARDEFRNSPSVFWVLPTNESRTRAIAWLGREGVHCENHNFYVAPFYPSGQIGDDELLRALRSRYPAQIIIGLGGGTQEPLGLYISRHLDYTPGIHCLGAAVGFLTGDQVAIPIWADRMFFGWLFRCFSDPKRFIPRYMKAAKLAVMLFRYRRQLPQLR